MSELQGGYCFYLNLRKGICPQEPYTAYISIYDVYNKERMHICIDKDCINLFDKERLQLFYKIVDTYTNLSNSLFLFITRLSILFELFDIRKFSC